MADSALDLYFKNTYGPSGTNTLKHYYPLSEASGNALDGIGSNNGVPGLGITQGVASILPTSDGQTCYSATQASGTNVALAANFGGYPKSYGIALKFAGVASGLNYLIQEGAFNNGIFVAYQQALGAIKISSPGTGATQTCPFSPVVGTFYDIVVTMDGSSGTKIYINSVSQTMTISGVPDPPVGAAASIMGALTSGGLNGSAEKYRIFNTVINQAQVTADYNALLNGAPPTGGPESPSLGGNVNAFLTGGFSGC